MFKPFNKNFGFALVGALVFASALSACGKSNNNGTGTGAGGSSGAISYTNGLPSCGGNLGRIGWSTACVDKSNFAYACNLTGGSAISSDVCKQVVSINNTLKGGAAFLSSNPAPIPGLAQAALPYNAGDSIQVTSANVNLGDVGSSSGSWGPFTWNFSGGFKCNNEVASTLSIRESNGTVSALSSGAHITLNSSGNTSSLMSGINSSFVANKCLDAQINLQIIHCENSAGNVVSCN